MFKGISDFFGNSKCHSIEEYYKDLARINAQQSLRITQKTDSAFADVKTHQAKVGSLIINTDNLSKEELQEVQKLSMKFKEIDDEIFILGIDLSLNYPGQYIDVKGSDAYKYIKEKKEATLEEARSAIQAYDEIRTQLRNRLEDAKLQAYSESAIPQGIRAGIQKQLEDKSSQQQNSEEIQIIPEQEIISEDDQETPVFSNAELLDAYKQSQKAADFAQGEIKQTFEAFKNSEKPNETDRETPSFDTAVQNAEPVAKVKIEYIPEEHIQDAVFEAVDNEDENPETLKIDFDLADNEVTKEDEAATKQVSDVNKVSEQKEKEESKTNSINYDTVKKILTKAKVIVRTIFLTLKEVISQIAAIYKNKKSESDNLYA